VTARLSSSGALTSARRRQPSAMRVDASRPNFHPALQRAGCSRDASRCITSELLPGAAAGRLLARCESMHHVRAGDRECRVVWSDGLHVQASSASGSRGIGSSGDRTRLPSRPSTSRPVAAVARGVKRCPPVDDLATRDGQPNEHPCGAPGKAGRDPRPGRDRTRRSMMRDPHRERSLRRPRSAEDAAEPRRRFIDSHHRRDLGG
jgi:hypothetical protein